MEARQVVPGQGVEAVRRIVGEGNVAARAAGVRATFDEMTVIAITLAWSGSSTSSGPGPGSDEEEHRERTRARCH